MSEEDKIRAAYLGLIMTLFGLLFFIMAVYVDGLNKIPCIAAGVILLIGVLYLITTKIEVIDTEPNQRL